MEEEVTRGEDGVYSLRGEPLFPQSSVCVDTWTGETTFSWTVTPS